MNEQNIEEFVDRIEGAYPGQRLFVKNMYKTFKREQFLLDMTVDQGRILFDRLINMCEVPPSLHEIKMIYFTHIYRKPAQPICEFCDNTGWIYPTDEHGLRKTRTNGLHDKDDNLLTYEYVVSCHCNEIN